MSIDYPLPYDCKIDKGFIDVKTTHYSKCLSVKSSVDLTHQKPRTLEQDFHIQRELRHCAGQEIRQHMYVIENP